MVQIAQLNIGCSDAQIRRRMERGWRQHINSVHKKEGVRVGGGGGGTQDANNKLQPQAQQELGASVCAYMSKVGEGGGGAGGSGALHEVPLQGGGGALCVR